MTISEKSPHRKVAQPALAKRMELVCVDLLLVRNLSPDRDRTRRLSQLLTMSLINLFIQASDADDDDVKKCPSERLLEQIPESVRGIIDKVIAIRLRPDRTSEAISTSILSSPYPPTIREHDLCNFLGVMDLELKLDSDYVQPFNNLPTVEFGIPTDFRPYVVQWMIHMHQWMGIPTRALHTAVGLMDLCTQLQPIACQDYQTLAMAALIMATLQWKPIFEVDFCKLCEITLNEMAPQQIRTMVASMRSWIGSRANFPIPHQFLDVFIFGLLDFTYDMIKWTRKACNYIFDLGLQDERLCHYSATLRCASVLYLIRYILKRKCDCSDDKQGGGKSCQYRNIPLWPEALVKFTSHHDTAILRRVSGIYLDALMLTQKYGVKFYQRCHSGSPNSVVFNKYMRPEYNYIAMDPKLRNFTHLDRIILASA
ncbi:hypothetical protein ECG_09710 [Echinococcus granulosus]|nr:hypothetical protein ECG_09710 [Echinococcus granulosus]